MQPSGRSQTILGHDVPLWLGEASHCSEVLHNEERRASDDILWATEAWVSIVTRTTCSACDSQITAHFLRSTLLGEVGDEDCDSIE